MLSLADGYLVKTIKFSQPRYVGDPINAVKILNDKEVDELFICDINASRTGVGVNYDLIEELCCEAFMPISYGGGIGTAEDAKRLFTLGVEKVVLNSVLRTTPELITEIASTAGSQSVVASLDVRKGPLRRVSASYQSGQLRAREDPLDWARRMEELGAGEILVHSIDRDGTRQGYDVPLTAAVADAVEVPVIAAGGARDLDDIRAVIRAGASGAAASSMFVFNGKHQAVLITYPDPVAVSALMEEP